MPSDDPRTVASRDELAHSLTVLRERAGLTVRDVAKATAIPLATVSGYFSGRHVPPASAADQVRRILVVCGVTEPDELDAWLDAVGRARRAPGRRPGSAPTPYRGLASFQPTDAEWFFGRESLTQLLVHLVLNGDANMPTVVVGPSGCGKSSLLRAGLVPALERHATAASAPQAGPTACVRLLTPGPRPMTSLADALADGAVQQPLFVVVDQAEELFTVSDASEAEKFLDAVANTEVMMRTGTQVVLGLRSDFYSAAMRRPQLVDALQHRQLVVGPMTDCEVRRAIVEPAARAGVDIEDGLVDLLLRDLAPRTGSGSVAHDPGALPLLSHALLTMWDRGSHRRLTIADYHAIRGIDGAVATTAEQLFADLDDASREQARRMFLRLVHVVDGLPIARRRLSLHELPDGTGGVVDRFVAGRLLTVDNDTVEIAHEALLRAWPRLRDWVDGDLVGLRLRRMLADAANIWRDNGRDPHLLQRGAPLDATRAWAEEPGHREQLNLLEREYLDASVAAATAAGREQARHQRRLRLLAGALALLLFVAVALTGVSFHETAVAEQHRDLAVSRQIAGTSDRLRSTDLALARQLALAAYRISPTFEARSSLLSVTATTAPTRLPAADGVLQSVAFSRDGRWLVAAGAGGALRLWDVRDRSHAPARARALSGATGTIYGAAFSPDGRFVAAGGSDHRVHLWSVGASPRPIATLTGPANTVYSVAFNPDGRSLIAGDANGVLWTWAVGNGAVSTTGKPSDVGHGAAAQAVAAAGALRAVAVGDDVLVSNAGHADAAPRQLSGFTAPVTSVAVSPDGRMLAAGSQDRSVRLWNISDPARPRPLGPPLTGATNWINAVAFTPDDRQVVAGSSDNQVRRWDIATGQIVDVLPHPAPVTAVAISADGHSVATADNDGIARLWTVPGPAVTAGGANIFGVTYLSASVLAAAGADGVRLWDTSSGGLQPLSGPVTAPTGRLSGSVAATPDGRLVAASGADGSVHLIDTSDPRAPRLVSSLHASKQMIELVAFGAGGRLLAAASDDGSVTVWEVSPDGHGRRLARLTGPTSYVNGVAFSPDGRTLAAGSADKTVWLWDISNPSAPRSLAGPLRGPSSYVYSVAFSPDAKTLAAGSDDKEVWLWSLASRARPRLLGRLHGPDSFVYSVAFSPDRRLLAAASGDGGVWLYDITRPAETRPLANLTGPVGAQFAVTFSPDGRSVVAGGADKILRMWQTSVSDAARSTCHAPGALVTRAEWSRYVPGAAFRSPCATQS